MTQLCTFAYVVVWPEIIYEVEYELEAEEIAKEKNRQGRGGQASSVGSESTEGESISNRRASGAISADMAAFGDAAIAGFGSGFVPALDDHSDLASSAATLRDLSLSHLPTLAWASRSSESPSSPESRSSPLILSPVSSPNDGHDSSPPAILIRTPTTSSTATESSSKPTPAEQAAEKARLERIADKAARELMERATAHARKVVPERTAHPSVNNARHLAGLSPHVILDAKNAEAKETRYLTAIASRLRNRGKPPGGTRSNSRQNPMPTSTGDKSDGVHGDIKAHNNSNNNNHGNKSSNARTPHGTTTSAAVKDGPEWDERVADTWQLFSKYFNGWSALERIALQEDMKRKDVWNLLTAMSEYLLCVRHW